MPRISMNSAQQRRVERQAAKVRHHRLLDLGLPAARRVDGMAQHLQGVVAGSYSAIRQSALIAEMLVEGRRDTAASRTMSAMVVSA